MKLKYLFSAVSVLLFFVFFVKPAFATTFTLSGSVKDSSGTGLSGSTIVVNDANSDTTTTDSSGNYSLPVPSGTYNVQVTPASGSGFTTAIALNQNISANTTLNFVLTPAGTVLLTGHLYDPLGNPLPNQQMYLSPSSGPRTPIINTDSQGNFSFQVSPGTYSITINSDPGSNVGLNAPETYTITKTGYSLTQTTYDLNLTLPAKKVIVNAQNQSANPVANVVINTQGSNINETNLSLGSLTGAAGSSNYTTNTRPTTDASGNAVLWLFPSTSATKYTLFATPSNGSGYAQTSLSGVNFTTDTTVNVTVPPAITVSGHLYDPLGNPLPNQQLYLLSGSGIRTNIVTTDNNGNYSLSIAPGVWSLTINSDPGNNSASINAPQNYSITASNLTFTTSATLNLTIPAKKVTLNMQNQLGGPLSGVTATTQGSNITVHNLTIAPSITNAQGYSNYTQTNISPQSNSQGDAALWLFPNTTTSKYTLFGTPPSGSGLAQNTLSNVVITSDTTLPMTFQVPTLSVDGHLYDPLGNALPNQQLYLLSSSGIRTNIVTTDGNGHFLLQAPAGTYTLTINSDPGNNVGLNAPQTYTISSPNFQVTQNMNNVSLTLPAKKVTVHVQDQGNSPVGNVVLATQGTAITEPNLSLSSSMTTATGSSTYTGNFVSTDPTTGNATLWLFPTTSTTNYTVIATPQQNSGFAQFTLNNVAVTGDQSEVVSLQYNHASPVTTAVLITQNPDTTYSDPTTVTLSASAAAGYTIPVENTFYTIDGGAQQAYTSPFTVTGNGNHTITYWSKDNSGYQEVHHTQTFTIVTTHNLTGRVYVDANQNGLQDSGETGYTGAVLTLNTNQTVTTDANGNYSFASLPADTYVETLTLPNGYTATTANPATVALNADTTQNFGIFSGPSFVTAINAGGNQAGNFATDTNFNGGSVYTTSTNADTSGISNPAPQAVYQSVRYGNFRYTVSNLTPNTSYTVRLHFNELYWNNAGARVFNVSANGQEVLSNYDIYAVAGGKDKAIVEQVPATADSNGNVTLQFSTVTDNAMVNGIEVYSGTLPSPTPTATPTPASSLAVNTGGAGSGNFASDNGFNGGSTYTTSNSVDTSAVTNPAPESVYQSVRYGNFSYTMSNLNPSTNYLVRLHLNELYWNSAGQRVFNVSVNGQSVLSNYDIYQAAGGANKAVIEQFVKPSDSTGKITVSFSTVVDNAMVNGIEVQDATSIPTYTLSGTVFNDANQNGFQDNGEINLSGRTVTLNNGESTTTDSNGNYIFTNLLSNSYTVRAVLPSGYTSTTQNPATVSVTSNTTQNFGLVQQNYAINTGGSSSGNFLADQNFSGGSVYSTSNAVDTSGVASPAPQAVYQSVRYGNFSYTIPNLVSNSTHSVRLHFNELYWNSAGSRVFDVSVGGTQVLSNYDIYQSAGGSNKAVTEDVQGTADGNGNLQIQFTTVTDNAMVNGIELLN